MGPLSLGPTNPPPCHATVSVTICHSKGPASTGMRDGRAIEAKRRKVSNRLRCRSGLRGATEGHPRGRPSKWDSFLGAPSLTRVWP
jgi:hypothetical protein